MSDAIKNLDVFLETREFYEACQQYRHSREPSQTPTAFEALKQWIRQGALGTYERCYESETKNE